MIYPSRELGKLPQGDITPSWQQPISLTNYLQVRANPIRLAEWSDDKNLYIADIQTLVI
jgi:hypothetical protein